MADILTRKKILLLVFLVFVAFMGWRMIRPMNIFVVSDNFAWPMSITDPPDGIDSLGAETCAECHPEIYREWKTSMHAKAWTDPYYQVDLQFDGNQQICLNCHIPLQNQQEHLVLGFQDKERFRPILEGNTDFDPVLQQEGVTCVVCHLRSGVLVGPYRNVEAPHPARFEPKMVDGFSICRKCHVVSGKRWDTFFRIPPCGTVSEIKKGQASSINCTGCHMPDISRKAVEGGKRRIGSYHTWRGGHDRETVKNALQANLQVFRKANNRQAHLEVTNIGADHFLPTGTPDRHLTILFVLHDAAGNVVKEKSFTLKRTIIWRPFIIDLWDTRLEKNIPREFVFSWKKDELPDNSTLAVTVRYHLLDEKRRKRIGYQNSTPISYPVFQQSVPLAQ